MRLLPCCRSTIPPCPFRRCFPWLILAATMTVFIMLPLVFTRKPKPATFVWPQNLTRQVSDFLLPLESTSVISPSSSQCGAAGGLSLLVVVCSAVENFLQRQTIRDTWAGRSLLPSGVKVVFLVGQTLNGTVQEDIVAETARFGDVIQESFMDSYANLTVKSLMMLKWFTQNCAEVPYLLKADDDMYINLPRLQEHVISMSGEGNDFLLGSLICGAVPIRDPWNKWYAPEYMFPTAVYPNYLSGTSYLLSRNSAERLLEASINTPIFHLEDIYITGILAQAVGIRPQDHVGFSYVKRQMYPCLYSQTISSHHLSSEEMREMSATLASAAGTSKCKPLSRLHLRSYGPGKCKWK